MANFWSCIDCFAAAILAKWNPASGTATKIYNAVENAKANGKLEVVLILTSGPSTQATLTCAKLRSLGYHATVSNWANNCIRVKVSWDPK